MRSFGRVVHQYARARGGQANPDFRADIAVEVAADLQMLFGRYAWPCFEKEYAVDLWGTETAALSSVSGDVARFSSAVKDRWLNQRLSIPGSTDGAFYRVTDILDGFSIRFSPAYAGSVVSAGALATFDEIEVTLPADFGQVIPPVFVGGFRVDEASSECLFAAQKVSSSGGSYCSYAVFDRVLMLPPGTADRLLFRYARQFRNLMVYEAGQALVESARRRAVLGTSTRWGVLPDQGRGFVFETKESVSRGWPLSNAVVLVDDDQTLLLEDDFAGGLDQALSYCLSTDLSLPPYMDRVLLTMADRSAGNATDTDVARDALRAQAVSRGSREGFSRGSDGLGVRYRARMQV